MIISVVSGGFDPIHSGHVRMIREAAMYGEELYVLVNSDEWLLRKKGYVSMCLAERMEIVSAIEGVDHVLPAADEDGTVCETLRRIHSDYPDALIVFCNGGDRGRDNTPEMSVVQDIGGRMTFGVGGEDKRNSSSTIWPKHVLARVQRLWGSYYDHFRNDNCVFKTLEIQPRMSTSMQKHSSREEVWFVERGHAVALVGQDLYIVQSGASLVIPRETWHRITAGAEGATIREMQFGFCSEDDIERSQT